MGGKSPPASAPKMPMKLYVLISAYDIEGVFSTLEKAMAYGEGNGPWRKSGKSWTQAQGFLLIFECELDTPINA